MPGLVCLYDRLITVLGLSGGFIFLAMALGICLDVCIRVATGSGVAWLIDVLEYAMLVATFLAVPWVLREGGHVTVDIVIANIPSGPRRVLSSIAAALGALISAVIVVYSLRAVVRAHDQGSLIMKTIIFPEWWPFAVVPFGMTLLTIEFVRLFARVQRADAAKPHAGPSGG